MENFLGTWFFGCQCYGPDSLRSVFTVYLGPFVRLWDVLPV